MNNITLYNNNCFDIFKKLVDENIKVDCIIADLPWEKKNNNFTNIIPLEKMWRYLYKLKKKNTPIILFSNQPFTTKLISSNMMDFKYCRYWEKDTPSNCFNANKQPLRNIEDISIFGEDNRTFVEDIIFFYENQPLYNPQKIEANISNSSEKPSFKENEKLKFPRQIMKYKKPYPIVHPREKPLELIEELIKTYTKENDLVLDFCMGSGSTGIACKNLHRNFIWVEINKEYFDLAIDRIKNQKKNRRRAIKFIWRKI